jgi:spore coat polysaccharide biosynthesis protein SpsF
VSEARRSGSWSDRRAVRIVATIEARMTSSRLPGKVLEDIGGMPMLGLMLRRLRASQTLDAVCVATTENPKDEPLVSLARHHGALSFRGSEDDVLARVLGAATASSADVIVELTGDCPLIDPGVVDACVLAYFSQDVHYCANTLERTFPRGLDTQVFSRSVLAEVAKLTDDPADREHVSLYIYEHPDRYALHNVSAVGDLAHPEWRWTVDTEDDLRFVRAVAAELGPDCTTRQMSRLLQARPDIVAINSHLVQKPLR